MSDVQFWGAFVFGLVMGSATVAALIEWLQRPRPEPQPESNPNPEAAPPDVPPEKVREMERALFREELRYRELGRPAPLGISRLRWSLQAEIARKESDRRWARYRAHLQTV